MSISTIHVQKHVSRQFLLVTLKVIFSCFSLRKVKMDQRKLMDNANTITDMAKVKNPIWKCAWFSRVISIEATTY